jgi:hypothetical protein
VQLQLEKSRNVLQPAATSKRHEEFHARSVTWKYLEGDPSGNNTVSTVSILCQYCNGSDAEQRQRRLEAVKRALPRYARINMLAPGELGRGNLCLSTFMMLSQHSLLVFPIFSLI